MFKQVVGSIRELFHTSGFIPLHEPRFIGNEKTYLEECIDTGFVSSVGKFVDLFEERIAEYTGSPYAVATVNGTAALHIALLTAGVKPDDEVITQPLTFIATANAIIYCGAKPVFVDVDKDTLGLSPVKLDEFLAEEARVGDDGFCYNKHSGRRIAACVPMHTFGHPCQIDSIKNICGKYRIVVVEDAAESLGSRYNGQHTGTFGELGIYSFNGNKTITAGGGGMIVTADEKLAKLAKHMTTQAKIPHKWEYVHDHIGYNYRMPNINAALGLAQLEKLDLFIQSKRKLAEEYRQFFANVSADIQFVCEPERAFSNYWLNAIIFKDRNERDRFLEYTDKNGVMTRSAWRLMNKLPMFSHYQCGDLENAEWIEDRLVNIPSSAVR